jgi:hypothetical protein
MSNFSEYVGNLDFDFNYLIKQSGGATGDIEPRTYVPVVPSPSSNTRYLKSGHEEHVTTDEQPGSSVYTTPREVYPETLRGTEVPPYSPQNSNIRPDLPQSERDKQHTQALAIDRAQFADFPLSRKWDFRLFLEQSLGVFELIWVVFRGKKQEFGFGVPIIIWTHLLDDDQVTSWYKTIFQPLHEENETKIRSLVAKLIHYVEQPPVQHLNDTHAFVIDQSEMATERRKKFIELFQGYSRHVKSRPEWRKYMRNFLFVYDFT